MSIKMITPYFSRKLMKSEQNLTNKLCLKQNSYVDKTKPGFYEQLQLRLKYL